MATEILSIEIREDGSRVVRRNIEDVAKTSQSATSSVLNLKNAILAIAGGVVLRQLGEMVNTFTKIQNRLRVVTNGTRELTSATQQLFDIAQNTRSSYENTVELYTRLSLATRQLGLSQQDTMKFTERLNKAIIVSGATSQEASNALIQFSQGMSKGVLNGDELRSVLEQLPMVADVIAKQMGVTRGALKQLGEQGLITAEQILEAFKNSAGEIDAAFAKTVVTLPQAFVVLKNQLVKTIGELDAELGISSALAKGIINFSKRLPDLVAEFRELLPVILAVTAAFAAYYIQMNLVGTGLLGLPGLFLKVRLAVLGLNAALLANPIVFIVAAIAGLVTWLVTMRHELRASENGFATFGDVMYVVFQGIKGLVQGAINYFKTWGDYLGEFFVVFDDVFEEIRSWTFARFLRAAAKAVDQVIGMFKGLPAAIKIVLSGLGPILKNAFLNPIDSLLGLLENNINLAVDAFNGLIEKYNALALTDPVALIAKVELVGEPTFVDEVAGLGERAMAALRDSMQNQTGAQDALSGLLESAEQRALKRMREAKLGQGDDSVPEKDDSGLLTARMLAIKDINRELEAQAKFLGMTNAQREIENNLWQIQESLRSKGVVLSQMELDIFKEKLQGLQVLAEEGALMEATAGIRENMIIQLQAYNDLIAKQPELLGLANAAMIEANSDILGGLSGTYEVLLAKHESVMERIQLLREANVISEQQANLAIMQSQNEMLEARLKNEEEFFGILAGLQTSGNKELAAAGKAAAIVQATISGFVAAQKALELGPILGPIAAAAIAIQTAANVNGIIAARALGGDTNKGQLTRVGERSMDRPEMFTGHSGKQYMIPSERGRVEPIRGAGPKAQGQQAPVNVTTQPAPVNVKSITLMDPNLLPDYLNSGDADEYVLNILSRNSAKFKQQHGIND